MSDQPENKRETSSLDLKRKKPLRIIVLLLVLSLIVVALVYFYREFSRSAEGTIRIIPQKYNTSDPDAPTVLTTHIKQYFSLTLPEAYEEKYRETQMATGTTLREQAYFSDPTGNLRKVAVTIDEKSGITPEDLTSYTYRKLHPEIYQEKKLLWKNQEIVTFEKNDSVYEIVAYIPEGNHLMASVAIVSAYEVSGKLIGDFSEILALFEWRE